MAASPKTEVSPAKPMMRAPSTAMPMRTFMSAVLRLSAAMAIGATKTRPATAATT